MSIDPHEIGRRIRRRRAYLGLTQREVAERAGLCRSVIIAIENGEHNTRIGDIVKIAEALEIETKTLFREEEL